MRSFIPLLLLAGCQTNFALQDEFSRAPITLFSGPPDVINSPYVADALFEIEVVGGADRDDVTVVSTDDAVIEVVDVRIDVDDDRRERIATVHAVGPGEAALQVRIDDRVRHAVDVVVAQPDRVEIYPIVDVAIEMFAESEPAPAPLERLDVMADAPFEVQLRPFNGDTALTGVPTVTVEGTGLRAELGELRSIERHPILELTVEEDASDEVVFRLSNTAWPLPVQSHIAPSSLSVRPVSCDESAGSIGRCYAVCDAETDAGDRLFGVYAEWSTDVEPGWTSTSPGDVLSYAIEADAADAVTASIPLTLTVGERTFTDDLPVRGIDSASAVESFGVERSIDIRGCAHTSGGALWLGLMGGILALTRRRSSRG